MPSDRRLICWDAWAFTELINRFSTHRADLLRIAHHAGGDTEVALLTSALAIAEVAGLVRHTVTRQPTGQVDLIEIERMWLSSRVQVQDVTLAVATLARDIVRSSRAMRPRRRLLDGPDAVYLATSSLFGADTLITGDAALLAHSGMLGVRICLPSVLAGELALDTPSSDGE